MPAKMTVYDSLFNCRSCLHHEYGRSDFSHGAKVSCEGQAIGRKNDQSAFWEWLSSSTVRSMKKSVSILDCFHQI